MEIPYRTIRPNVWFMILSRGSPLIHYRKWIYDKILLQYDVNIHFSAESCCWCRVKCKSYEMGKVRQRSKSVLFNSSSWYITSSQTNLVLFSCLRNTWIAILVELHIIQSEQTLVVHIIFINILDKYWCFIEVRTLICTSVLFWYTRRFV